ncbi:MAG: hypothetical protein R6U44_01715 [Archaeoglobaceae archaeon]
MRTTVKCDKNGRITLPIELREALDIKDKVAYLEIDVSVVKIGEK